MFSLQRNTETNSWDEIQGNTCFTLCDVSAFSMRDKLLFSTTRKDSYYHSVEHETNFIFTMHFDMSPMHLVLTFQLNPETLLDKSFAICWHRFLQGDDKYKNARIKLTPSLVNKNWLVKNIMSTSSETHIGQLMQCHYRQKHNLLECTCDVSGCFGVRTILKMAKYFCKHMVCDLVITIEPTQADEFPERILAGARIIHHDMQNYAYAS